MRSRTWVLLTWTCRTQLIVCGNNARRWESTHGSTPNRAVRMKIQIDKSYPMPCTPEVAWEFLQNLEAVAGCMPGAKITERLDPNRYKGTVTARVGPATMSFRGEVEMKDVDPTA